MPGGGNPSRRGGLDISMPERNLLTLTKDGRYHVIDNTDVRSLSKTRLEYVYGPGDYEDLLDVFYKVKPGTINSATDAAGNVVYYASL